MADNLNVFVLDELGNSYQGLTKEQIYTAIQNYNQTGSFGDIDSGFVSKLKEMNKQGNIKFWIGTQAEFQALETKDEETLYLFSNDPTINDIENAINDLDTSIDTINDRLDDLGFKSAVATISGTSVVPSVNSLTKVGKRVIFNLEMMGQDVNKPEHILITLPAEFRPKEDIEAGFDNTTITVYSNIQTSSYGSYNIDYDNSSGSALALVTLSIKNIGWETN